MEVITLQPLNLNRKNNIFDKTLHHLTVDSATVWTMDTQSVESAGIKFEAKKSYRFSYLQAIKFCVWNILLIGYVVYASIVFADQRELNSFDLKNYWSNLPDVNPSDKSCGLECEFELCSPFNTLIFVVSIIYLSIFYKFVFKNLCNPWIKVNLIKPTSSVFREIFSSRWEWRVWCNKEVFW